MKKTLSTLIIAIASAVSVNAHADDLLSVYQQALLNDTTVLKAQAQFNIVKEDINQAHPHSTIGIFDFQFCHEILSLSRDIIPLLLLTNVLNV
jgi:hypothetical protein